jgi:hypothetical protein
MARYLKMKKTRSRETEREKGLLAVKFLGPNTTLRHSYAL